VLCHHALDGFAHLAPVGVPVAGHVEVCKSRQLGAPLHQGHHGARHIGQKGPLVAHARRGRQQHALGQPAWLDQALRKPAIARLRAEEIASTHDQHLAGVLGSRARGL